MERATGLGMTWRFVTLLLIDSPHLESRTLFRRTGCAHSRTFSAELRAALKSLPFVTVARRARFIPMNTNVATVKTSVHLASPDCVLVGRFDPGSGRPCRDLDCFQADFVVHSCGNHRLGCTTLPAVDPCGCDCRSTCSKLTRDTVQAA